MKRVPAFYLSISYILCYRRDSESDVGQGLEFVVVGIKRILTIVHKAILHLEHQVFVQLDVGADGIDCLQR